ncbi:ABC transporter permease subunit [[Mycoplasma] gypis]|uniref:ABC transporter permease subunit n=1 Tax=[Mycoplasma] gypis TaxID=92404 RepID=A0ABZ2RN02_9BACT|nr:ABC transporter permease subunit [[Mycoplasma] gypis]MBN0919571.1 peptide ABC transporter permease [[Mycoplasma] gypis]
MNSFKFSKNKKINSNIISNKTSSLKRFWKDFSSKKVNILVAILLLLFIVLAIIFSVFSSFSPTKPVNENTFLLNDLPPYNFGIITRNFSRGSQLNFIYEIANKELLRASELGQQPVFVILKDSSKQIDSALKTVNTDIVTLTYNAYDLLKAIQLNASEAFNINTHFILGTNQNGVDIWTRIWSSTIKTVIFVLLALMINIFSGFLLGSITQMYKTKGASFVINSLASLINSIPEIIWIFIICGFWNTSWVAVFIAFCLIGWVPFFNLVQRMTQQLKNSDLFLVLLSIGKNKFQIIYSDLFKISLPRIFIETIEKFSSYILIISSLAFLDFVKNSNSDLLSNLIKESIQMISINNLYLVLLIINISIISFGFKYLSNAFASTYQKQNIIN